jgi:RNase H-fold protein (predicted Holliday junction resolvase)
LEKSQTTLAIDIGSKYIGFAMVRNELTANVPLFTGTLVYEKNYLREKVEGSCPTS